LLQDTESRIHPDAKTDTGVQERGWPLDKRIGFRGGGYEGMFF
jgi:hypothetical protein